MKHRFVSIGIVQMAMSSSKDKNIARAKKLVERAAKKGAHIVCLPELFYTRYFPQYPASKEDFSEPSSGPLVKTLSSLALEHGIVLVGGSLWEKEGSHKYNTTFVFDEKGALLGTYRKMHIPHDECFFEQNYFEKGNKGYVVFNTTYGTIAPLICFDQWFPEPARICALLGAEMIFYPTAIGTVRGIQQKEGRWLSAWRTVMRGHAIANSVVVVACNRVGKEDRIRFFGHSFLCDAFGRILIEGKSEECVLVSTIDRFHGKQIQEGWGFFRSRRPDSYRRLIEE